MTNKEIEEPKFEPQYWKDNVQSVDKLTEKCQVCDGKLVYCFNKFWGWFFGSHWKCEICGRKWTNRLGIG